MAPPIPGLRKPVQIRRRSPGDVLAGVGAIVLLTALQSFRTKPLRHGLV